MAVKGVFASDAGIQGEARGDFRSKLLEIDPTGRAPMFALTAGMEDTDTQSSIVTWFEENKLSGRINVTNNAGVGQTLTVDDATQTVIGATYLVESSGEYVLVIGVNGNDLTVLRGISDVPATSIDGSGTPVPIQKIGNAQEENSAAPVAVANLGYPRFNYTQIFRNTWDISGTAAAQAFHTGGKKAKNSRDAALLHAEDIEKSLLHGVQFIGVQNQQPLRMFDGVVTQIKTNVFAQVTDVGYTDFRDFLQAVFERNIKGQPNERIAFCGNSVMAVVDSISAGISHMNTAPGQTDFGMKVVRWMTPFGDINLVTHPLMVESPLWTKDLYVIHPGALELNWMRRTHHDMYDKDGTRAGRDGDYGVFTSELSCKYMAERTGGVFTGIDTPRTDSL